MKLVSKYLPNTDVTPENLYQDVELILWGNDVVFNTNFAPLTELVVEVREIIIAKTFIVIRNIEK